MKKLITLFLLVQTGTLMYGMHRSNKHILAIEFRESRDPIGLSAAHTLAATASTAVAPEATCATLAGYTVVSAGASVATGAASAPLLPVATITSPTVAPTATVTLCTIL